MSITSSAFSGHCISVRFHEVELVMELEEVKVSVHLRFTDVNVRMVMRLEE